MAGTGRTGRRAVARWRTAAGVVLAVLAGLTAALTPVAGWANTLLDDTDVFVTRYTPVVRSEAVQQVLTTGLTDAIIARLGVDNALVRPLVTRVVTEAVASQAFADATTRALRLAHTEMAAQLSGQTGRLQVSDGVVQLPYAPFVDAVTQRLSDAGVPFVDRLPRVSGGITLLTIDPELLPALQSGYRILHLCASWLGWLAAALALAAACVWPGVRRPLIGLGLSLLGGVLVVGLAWYLGTHWLSHRLGEGLNAVAGQVAQVTTEPVVAPLLALGVFGAVLATFAGLSVRHEPVSG